MTTANVMLPQQGTLSDLAGWIAGDLGAGYARLFTNNHVFAPTDTCADYTEAAFTGYAPVHPLAWGTPFINGGGKAETDSTVCTFTFSGGTGSFTTFGLYVTDLSLTKLLLVMPFISPVIFTPSSPTESFVIQLTEVSELQ